MVRKRVAVVEPTISPGGGTEAITAWIIEALKEEYQVDLLTFSNVDAEDFNRFYGTSLRDEEFSIVHPPMLPMLKRVNRMSMLKDHLMMRYCKSIGEGADLFIGVERAMDFGRPSIQYIGLAPASALVQTLVNKRGRLFGMPLLRNYFMRLSESISSFSETAMQQNVTLVNSAWTGKLTEKVYGIDDYQVVYPPVSAPPALSPWNSREIGFLCIARLVPEKRTDKVIQILAAVREKGFDVSLHIVGRPDDRRHFKRIRQLAEENSSWVTLTGTLQKKELFELMNWYKYGINAARDEPFGIAVAEMIRAGCVVFIANGGGQIEIVDTPELTFDDDADAVDKITAVLDCGTLQTELLDRLRNRAEGFSSQAFCRSIQKIVGNFFGLEPPSRDLPTATGRQQSS